MNTFKKLNKQLECQVVWARLASFGQLGLISDSHIHLKKNRNGSTITKRPELNNTEIGEGVLRLPHGPNTNCCEDKYIVDACSENKYIVDAYRNKH